MESTYTITGAQKLLDALNECNCCCRHKLNRPSKLEQWIETPVKNKPLPQCKCDCRHKARFVCREMFWHE